MMIVIHDAAITCIAMKSTFCCVSVALITKIAKFLF